MATHVVHRQFITADVIGTEDDGIQVQRHLSAMNADRLLPALGAVFNRLDKHQGHLVINRMIIDAGRLSRKSLEHDLVEIVSSAVEQELRARFSVISAPPPPSDGHGNQDDGDVRDGQEDGWRSPTRAVADALVHFLRTGLLPWWYKTEIDRSFADTVQETWQAEDGRKLLLSHLIGLPGSTAMAQRLVRQFPVTFVRAVAEALSPAVAAQAESYLATISRLAPALESQLRPIMWETVLSFNPATAQSLSTLLAARLWSPEGQFETNEMRSALALLQQHQIDVAQPSQSATVAPRAAPSTTPGPALSLELDKGLHVDCAGVVLLHPFLPQLFTTLGFANGKILEQAARAMAIIHYLASGENHAPEYVLAMPKLLCGLSIQDVAEGPICLTEAEMMEADRLLEAVVRHWSALGNTSIDGLRGSFLVRSGRYKTTSGTHQLDVEAKSFDILLDQLPWGIGTVQLPWMKNLLWVEWRR